MRKYTSTLAVYATATAFCIALGACGSDGAPGSNGLPCTVTSNADHSSTITCPDGTSVTVPVGAAGDAGPVGETGVPGPVGDSGTSCSVVDNGDGTKTITCTDGTKVVVSSAIVDYALLSADQQAVLDPNMVITDVKFPADGKPVVTVKISDRAGVGIKGLNSLTTSAAVTWRLSVLKLTAGVNASANDTWVSYIAADAKSTASAEQANPTTTPVAGQGTLKDNGDGTYIYTFDKIITDATKAGTTYEADKTHRVIVLAYKGGNPFRPMNAWKDLVPGTGADMSGKNDKVDGSACLDCHSDFRAPARGTRAFHSGTRYDVHTCPACHNDQRRFSSTGTLVTEPTITASTVNPGTFTWTGALSVLNGEAVVNFPVFIHKMHMGKDLDIIPDRDGGSGDYTAKPFDETTFPQDIRNCAKCHKTVDKAANWQNVPSRRACGACHDKTSFVDPPPVGRVKHSGGALADDTKCNICHAATDIAGYHKPVALPNTIITGTLPAAPDGQTVVSGWQADGTASGKSCTTSSPCTCSTTTPCLPSANSAAAYVAATGYVPTGAAKITYDVKEVLVDSTSKNPKVVFKLLKDGKDVDFGTYVAGTKTELIDGFVGSPSVYLAWSLPQDGVKAPADFNASASVYIKSVWNGTVTTSTLVRDTTTGYYTLTIGSVVMPTTAKMLTGGLGYTYSLSGTQPLTQTGLTGYSYNATTKVGGLIVPAPDVWKTATGHSARRAIVETAKCNKCHEGLGINPSFHTGQRNDGPTCVFCHNTNRTSSAWAVNAKDFIHSLHGAGKRSTPFTWHGEIKAWEVTYPGVLNNCEQCHTAGTYDFSASASNSALPNMLYSTAATGTFASTPTAPATIAPFVSPYVTKDTVNYGVGYATSNQTSGTRGGVACTSTAPCVCSLTAPCDAESTTLVHSPVTAACAACHDSPVARKHFADNNGSFYTPRSTALSKPEQCLMCHGPGKVAAIATVHQ